MITIVNFSHRITEQQRADILEDLTADDLTVLDVRTNFDPARPYGPQAEALVNSVELSMDQWQTESIVINLPSYNVIAALVLARVHGLMGHFPRILRIREASSGYEFAETIDLRLHRVRGASLRDSKS